MSKYEVDATYAQFYVADSVIEQEAPDVWEDSHIIQRYNSLENIVAFKTEGNCTARIYCSLSGEELLIDEPAEFETVATIEVETGKIGVYGWPWEKLEEYTVAPGTYVITFRGYNLAAVGDERDYYVVEVRHA